MKQYCETCGANCGLTKSHFIKKNSVHKTKLAEYDYDDPVNYMTQCLTCHQKYELLNKRQRIAFLASLRLIPYAVRASWLVNE